MKRKNHSQSPQPNRQVKNQGKSSLASDDAVQSSTDASEGEIEALRNRDALQQLTHRVLAVQEQDRSDLSEHLQEEVSQMLLGIMVRLLALKRETRSDVEQLVTDISSTKKLSAETHKIALQLTGLDHLR